MQILFHVLIKTFNPDRKHTFHYQSKILVVFAVSLLLVSFPCSQSFIYYFLSVTADFYFLVPEFFGERSSLLSYKTLHNEVFWTEVNSGNSKFTLFAAQLTFLHNVLLYQNTIKIRINGEAKSLSTSRVFLHSREKAFLSYLSHGQAHMTMQLTNHIYYKIKLLYSIFLYG